MHCDVYAACFPSVVFSPTLIEYSLIWADIRMCKTAIYLVLAQGRHKNLITITEAHKLAAVTEVSVSENKGCSCRGQQV